MGASWRAHGRRFGSPTDRRFFCQSDPLYLRGVCVEVCSYPLRLYTRRLGSLHRDAASWQASETCAFEEGRVWPFLRSRSASCFAATASASARSLPGLWGPAFLECPLIFFHRTSWWRRTASRSLSHRSLFATGLPSWFSHPFLRHFSCHPLLMQLTR